MDKATPTPSPASADTRDIVLRLRDTPNWLYESYASWKDSVCKYSRAPFEAADEIERLRAEVERLAAQAAPTEAEYNPLLIDGVQHDPLCLKVYRSPLKECDCGASSRAAQPSQAPVVLAVQPEYCTACDMTSNDKQRCEDCPRRASSGATPADVRMLTADEQNAIIDMHNTGRAQGDHECAEAIQRAAFRVNAGKRIPADGKIGSAA